MTKSELVEAIAAETKMTQNRAEAVANCIFESMTDAIVRGEGIEVRGFGSFTVRDYKPYTGRNPKTGETIHIAAKRLPFFKAGVGMRGIINPEDSSTTDD